MQINWSSLKLVPASCLLLHKTSLKTLLLLREMLTKWSLLKLDPKIHLSTQTLVLLSLLQDTTGTVKSLLLSLKPKSHLFTQTPVSRSPRLDITGMDKSHLPWPKLEEWLKSTSEKNKHKLHYIDWNDKIQKLKLKMKNKWLLKIVVKKVLNYLRVDITNYLPT